MDPASLAQSGPTAIVIAGIIAIVAGAIRGDWVPGWLYRAQVARAEKAETQQERNAETLREAVRLVKETRDSAGRAPDA